MHDDRILVLGAGELGMPVLRHLARRAASASGVEVAAFLRPGSIAATDPARRRQVEGLRALGVELVAGDLDAPEAELAATFRGFRTVVGCTGFAAGRRSQLKLARAALDAGVGRYVPWQFGVDYDAIGRGSAQDLFDEQLDVRDLLRSQGETAWIIISTGMFTSFLFEPSFGVVDLANDTVHALGGWDNAVTVTTPEDIGRLTAEILFEEPEVRDRVVSTAGDTLTFGRLAEVVEATLGRPFRRVEWGLDRLRADLAADPGDPIKKYRVVFAEGRGVSWPVAATFNGERGIEVADVARWIRENLA